jgi:5'-3' exonuclease
MGIPSYYKKLVMTVKGLTGKSTESAAAHLWFDYNCLVYHVLRQMRPYVPDERSAWEAELIAATVKYTKKVIQASGVIKPGPASVFLGVDGPVPAAKVNQQRRRRWNSVQTLEEERRMGKQDGSPVWDRNAITPGTHFMDALSTALTAERGAWTVSPVEEAGEGEHKIMSRLRGLKDAGSEREPQTHILYGLDADLILLSLYHLRFLHPQSTFYLMREDERESTAERTVYSYLNVNKLRDALITKMKRVGEDADAALTDYIFAMTLLGNDFLPHGLQLTLKGNGYEHLMRLLTQADRPRLILSAGANASPNGNQPLQWNPEGLAYVFRYYAALEEGFIVDEIQHKREGVRRKVVYGDDEAEPWARAYSQWMKTPARRMDEYALVSDVYEDAVKLKAGWRQTYYRAWFGSVYRLSVCDAYLEGLHWVLRYYTGEPVNPFWYYPWNLPPLYADLASRVRTKGIDSLTAAITMPADFRPLLPTEQCAIVMPASSLHLCKDKRYHRLPALVPHYYPAECRMFYVGKHQMWECEPLLPVLTVERLRTLFKE